MTLLGEAHKHTFWFLKGKKVRTYIKKFKEIFNKRRKASIKIKFCGKKGVVASFSFPFLCDYLYVILTNEMNE